MDDEGRLRLRVTAPPFEGAANDAVLRLLADDLGVSRSAVRIRRGQSGRVKLVSVDGATSEDLLKRWPGLSLDEHTDGENNAGRR